MEDLKLFDGEYKFASIIWDNEPLGSGELVRLSADQLGWKKSTTYTVLKKLCDRGILKNKASMVSSIVKREQVQKYESKAVLDKAFEGSLPRFLTAFLSDRKLSAREAEDIKQLIDSYREE